MTEPCICGERDCTWCGKSDEQRLTESVRRSAGVPNRRSATVPSAKDGERVADEWALHVTMKDRSVWAVPVMVIARNRAAHTRTITAATWSVR